MKLRARILVVCSVTIAKAGERKGMQTDVSLALPDARPATITQALDDYVVQCWSRQPHEILMLHAAKIAGELYAAMDDEPGETAR